MKFKLLLFLTLFSTHLIGQNLVPNPSFEEYKRLPCSFSGHDDLFLSDILEEWYAPTEGTTDALTNLTDIDCILHCMSNSELRWGHQQPRTGDWHSMIWTWTVLQGNISYREYLQIKLKDKLLPGKKYKISFYVSLCDEADLMSNNIGALLTRSRLTKDIVDQLDYAPHINVDSIITDSIGWVEVSGTLIAEDSYQYLTIGNFYDNANTDTIQHIHETPFLRKAAYFVDDVSLSRVCSSYAYEQIDVCAGDSIQLINNDPEFTAWIQSDKPDLILSTENIYGIKANNSTEYAALVGCDTLRYTISVSNVPQVNLGKDSTICFGDTLLLNSGLQEGEFLWQDNSASPYFAVYEEGLYILEISNACGSASDSIFIDLKEKPELNLGQDTIICEGTSIILDAYYPDVSYVWQDQSSGSQLLVEEAGLYFVELSNSCATVRDSIIIESIVLPELNLGSDTLLCFGDSLHINASLSGYITIWDDNSFGAIKTITESGQYGMQIFHECGIIEDQIHVTFEDCGCSILSPNIFSPNNDGINDLFKLNIYCPLDNFNLKIYDRWGALVFSTIDQNESWDGTFKGESVLPGVYAYLLEYSIDNTPMHLAGDLTILR